jgi:hypothetical protein
VREESAWGGLTQSCKRAVASLSTICGYLTAETSKR